MTARYARDIDVQLGDLIYLDAELRHPATVTSIDLARGEIRAICGFCKGTVINRRDDDRLYRSLHPCDSLAAKKSGTAS